MTRRKPAWWGSRRPDEPNPLDTDNNRRPRQGDAHADESPSHQTHKCHKRAFLGPAAPLPQHLDAPLNNDYYGAVLGPRLPTRLGSPVQNRLTKLDVFKGENGESGWVYIYQVQEFAAFHAWDPVETCRQASTHLRGVALACIWCTPLPPRNCPELRDLLMQRFQPRDLAAADKAQFRARQRHRCEDIHAYV